MRDARREQILHSMNDERFGRNGTNYFSPVVSLSSKTTRYRCACQACTTRWREHPSEVAVRKPGWVKRASVRAVHAGIVTLEVVWGQTLEHGTVRCRQSLQCIIMKSREPVTRRTDSVDQHESTYRVSITFTFGA